MAARRVGWLIWLLAVGALYFFENNAGTRAVLFASLFAPTLSILCALWTARRGRVETEAPNRLLAGESAPWRARVDGAPRRFCRLSGSLEIANALTGETAWLEIDSNAGEMRAPLRGERCGCLRVRLTDARAVDWFGLAGFHLRGQFEDDVLVEPPLFPVSISETAPGFGEAPVPGREGKGEPDGGARDFRPGDAVRSIHWKLSGKTGRLLVRETARPDAPSWALLLETSIPGEACPELGEEAQALLSVSRSLLEARIAHAVFWFDREARRMEVAGEADYDAMKDALLRARRAPGGESVGRLFEAELAREMAERIVVFSARPDTDAFCLADRAEVALVLPERDASCVRAVSIEDLKEGALL